MNISRPKEYISILIDEIKNIMKSSVSNFCHETHTGLCSPVDSRDRLNTEMAKVDDLKNEIIFICESMENKKPCMLRNEL